MSILKIKIDAKVILTVNLYIQDHLTNNQTGNTSHIDFSQRTVQKVYVKFSDERGGLKAMRSCYLGGRNYWVPIEKSEARISVKKESASPSIKRTQFHLILAWTSTFHKVQSLSLKQGVMNFDLPKQKSFGPGQIYTALK